MTSTLWPAHERGDTRSVIDRDTNLDHRARPSRIGSFIADRAVEVGWNMLQPALLRVDRWRLACSDPPVLDCTEGYDAVIWEHTRETLKPTDLA